MTWFRNILLYLLKCWKLPIPSVEGWARRHIVTQKFLCGAAGVGLILLLFNSCEEQKKGPVLFNALASERTGLDFSNNLNSSDSFNLFKYMYFYNGAGVGAGDFNNDGLTDVFFASNQGDNALYLNKGNLEFKNVTKEANIPNDKAWSTGVSVVDINNDGLLDIYVSRVGKYRILNSHNQFLICQGIDKNGVPQYIDKAKEMGLDFSGFGTQAAFFDYDLDGDVDIFLLNHSVHENGTFRARNEFTGTYHASAGSKMFRNDNGTFIDITKESGINSTAIGYGLGITISDINIDGYPDIYIGNDFHENDYLYINQTNGTFKDVSGSSMMHTSQFTMGVDVADADNDGYPEIISMDMLPADPYILKRSLGEDTYDIFFMKISYGYNYQYTRNNLQLNKRNGNFSETGLYSGVAATDWSWSPLWTDFDNDGLKDLFISNGIPKRMNDIDYINYVSDQEIQQKIKNNKIDEKDKILIEKFPQIKIPNKFFKNAGDMKFTDIEASIGDNNGSYSNGAVYADFDNDGDMDIIVNNIDENAVLYENKLNQNANAPYIQLSLKGSPKNINAIGARIVMFTGKEIRTYEKFPVHGFLSSMEVPVHIGMAGVKPDSMILVWPDNTCQTIQPDTSKKKLIIQYQPGLPSFNYSLISNHYKPASGKFEDITAQTGFNYLHQENKFPEFDREPLMPHMVSTEGPALAIADINGDGMDDIFIGSSKGYKSEIFIQRPGGKFEISFQPSMDTDSSYEDIDACWADVNNDQFPDLVIASGGNEYYGKDKHLLPRVYLNDGKGLLTKKQDAFEDIYQTASCVAAYDFNSDGFTDLFIGGRVVPWEYGKIPPSYLLQNDGTGKFRDVTALYSDELGLAGFVTKALWFDIDKDKRKDLLICSEWGTIDAYMNRSGKFEKRILTDKKGWWNTIDITDINNDGNPDIVAGNLGLNSRLKASTQHPVRLYYNDFDGNGKKEQVLTYYINDREIPFANKSEMEKQMPPIRKDFLYAKDFANATLKELVGKDKLSESVVFSADYFSHCILINDGKMNFTVQELPWQTQLSPLRSIMTVDANNDQFPDLIVAGNFYQNNIEMGRNDASFGSILLNDGKGKLNYEDINGVVIKGETRNIRKILIDGKEACVIARNNDSAMVISIPARKSP